MSSAVPTERLKPGWKRDADGVAVDPVTWREQYVVRAICVPVASPNEIGKGSPEAWAGLRAALKEAWTRSTEAANWALRRLLANDVSRTPGQAKCPKMPKIYLYGERDWTGWSQSAAAVLRTIESSYRSKRYQVIWTGGASLPNVRYPYPYPVHNKGWSLTENPDGGLFFEALLPGGRVNVRLKGGPQFRKQLIQARWLIANSHLRGEASIYQKGSMIFIKLVGWFPKQVDREADGIMFVNTTAESFLVGFNSKEERLWIINGDRARRWMTRSKRALQRSGEDRKYEMRSTKREARKRIEDMQESCSKNRNRLNSFIDESAAQVINHCRRRRMKTIVYNDSCREFFSDFQWFRLALQIEQKCAAFGIEFRKATNEEAIDGAAEGMEQDTAKAAGKS